MLWIHINCITSIKHINIHQMIGGYIMDEPLMTVEEVSVMLNISEQTIRRYIRNKELNAIKFKRSYRITKEVMLVYI